MNVLRFRSLVLVIFWVFAYYVVLYQIVTVCKEHHWKQLPCHVRHLCPDYWLLGCTSYVAYEQYNCVNCILYWSECCDTGRTGQVVTWPYWSCCAVLLICYCVSLGTTVLTVADLVHAGAIVVTEVMQLPAAFTGRLLSASFLHVLWLLYLLLHVSSFAEKLTMELWIWVKGKAPVLF